MLFVLLVWGWFVSGVAVFGKTTPGYIQLLQLEQQKREMRVRGDLLEEQLRALEKELDGLRHSKEVQSREIRRRLQLYPPGSLVMIVEPPSSF
jgi:hypothetical protein